MTYEESIEIEVGGVTFEVYVEEKKGCRRIDVYDMKQSKKEHRLYLVARSYEQEYNPGIIGKLLGKKTEKLPNREEHVRTAFSNAIAEYFNQKEKEQEVKEMLEENVETVGEAWEEVL